MNFSDLTAEEAEAYRAQIQADGPARLSELARLLAGDGVSLDQFDATIPSLVPLWQWYLSFARADFPGILATAQPRSNAVTGFGPENSRARYASELVTHYLFEVARTCFSEVEWITNPHVGMDSYQRTAVRYVDDNGSQGLCNLDRFSDGITLVLERGDPKYEATDFLAERFLVGPFLCGGATEARCLTIPRGASILIGLLPLEASPEIVFTRDEAPKLPVETPTPPFDHAAASDHDIDGSGVDEVGGELVFAHISADVETLEEAPPLDLAVVVPVLVHLGFRTIDGELPTAKGILAEEFAEFVRGDDALITTMSAGGKLRAVQIASITPTASAWAEITDAFTALARPLNARLAPEDEF